MTTIKEHAESVLARYRLAEKPLYIVGTFDSGVTVFSQQIRALNLVWALIESEQIPCLVPNQTATDAIKIAIVGGGFAGLSVAAGLIKKRANVRITIFEERDTLLPLQQGSDSRWLHPRIYDWPAQGSDASVAMLPVLNWSAARASDVVVQILSEWENVLSDWTAFLKELGGSAADNRHPSLFCNARHLQIHETNGTPNYLQIEWVGERRNMQDATALRDVHREALGASADFDHVILTVGFGLERDDAHSYYWRNEGLGQPNLDQPRCTYLVSGQGDGAMIDLLRLRISQYRQDRILDELFRDRSELLQAIKGLHHEYSGDRDGLFNQFESLTNNPSCGAELELVCDDLARRLRRDTEVVLQLKVRKLFELFDFSQTKTRISFQNKLLVYLLYKCGGFFPSTLDDKKLCQQHSIAPDKVVRRHGTFRDEQLKRVVSKSLYDAIQNRRGYPKPAFPDPFSQSSKLEWSGGFFGYPGPSKDADKLEDDVRIYWRKEYLPGPTALLGTTFCSSLAGALREAHPGRGSLRVTLHRTLLVGDEELLQQTCDYVGSDDKPQPISSAARTFPTDEATIGLAYGCRKIVRSLQGTTPADLKTAMDLMGLHKGARAMSEGVGFVLAIPILEPEENMSFTAPSPVAGIIYVDSGIDGFFVDNEELRRLVSMIQKFVDGLESTPKIAFDRLRNVPLTGLGTKVRPAALLPDNVKRALELVSAVACPKTSKPFQFNYDYSDFVPVRA